MPKQTKFGMCPDSDEELIKAFLGTDDYLISGSPIWNALNLGATGVMAVTLVYNKKRSCRVVLGGRRFWFRRVKYPSLNPPVEWWVQDLLKNHAVAGVSREEVLERLAARDQGFRLWM